MTPAADQLRTREVIDQDWIRRLLAEAEPRPVVYFIGWVGGPIKIGFASDLQHRLHQLQSHCPYELRVWAVREGARELEQQYHRRFKNWRLRGEWFERGYPILHEVDRLHHFNRKGWKVPEHVRGRAKPCALSGGDK